VAAACWWSRRLAAEMMSREIWLGMLSPPVRRDETPALSNRKVATTWSFWGPHDLGGTNG
jgi:hypothetical protein